MTQGNVPIKYDFSDSDDDDMSGIINKRKDGTFCRRARDARLEEADDIGSSCAKNKDDSEDDNELMQELLLDLYSFNPKRELQGTGVNEDADAGPSCQMRKYNPLGLNMLGDSEIKMEDESEEEYKKRMRSYQRTNESYEEHCKRIKSYDRIDDLHKKADDVQKWDAVQEAYVLKRYKKDDDIMVMDSNAMPPAACVGPNKKEFEKRDIIVQTILESAERARASRLPSKAENGIKIEPDTAGSSGFGTSAIHGAAGAPRAAVKIEQGGGWGGPNAANNAMPRARRKWAQDVLRDEAILQNVVKEVKESMGSVPVVRLNSYNSGIKQATRRQLTLTVAVRPKPHDRVYEILENGILKKKDKEIYLSIDKVCLNVFLMVILLCFVFRVLYIA